MKKSIILIIIFILSIGSTFAQTDSIIGQWKTVDEEGKAKSVVEIFKKDDGKFYGKIVKIFNKDKQDAVCKECDEDDARYNKKILGMEIITELEKDGSEYEDGEILDPNNGKVYDCKLWVENDRLQVRGYVLFFHRTQEWLPYKEG